MSAANVFRAMAEQLDAGETYEHVLKDYGYLHSDDIECGRHPSWKLVWCAKCVAQERTHAASEIREECIDALRTLWEEGGWVDNNCMECGITFKDVVAAIRARG